MRQVTCVPCGLLRDVTSETSDDEVDDDVNVSHQCETQYSKVLNAFNKIMRWAFDYLQHVQATVGAWGIEGIIKKK